MEQRKRSFRDAAASIPSPEKFIDHLFQEVLKTSEVSGRKAGDSRATEEGRDT